jgi:hypothetical protein
MSRHHLSQRPLQRQRISATPAKSQVGYDHEQRFGGQVH